MSVTWTRLFLLILVLVSLPSTFAWTPFLNRYHPTSPSRYQTQQDLSSALQQNDLLMADTINEFILCSLYSGHFSTPTGWGFPYTYPPDGEPSLFATHRQRAMKWTPFDQYGSLYAQRSRFPQLSMLARQKLEIQGLQVRKLEIFENGRGIYIKWDIVDPTAPPRWNDGWRMIEEGINGRPHRYVTNQGYNGYNFEGEDACRDAPEALCRLRDFFDDPLDFLRRN